MADTTTTNLLLTLPEVGSSSDTWGNKLNTDLQKIDNQFTTISAIAVLRLAAGGTQASTAAAARTNLGLGTIVTQDASAVNLTGGSMTGMSSITSTGPIWAGGTGFKFPDGTIQSTATSPSGSVIWSTQSGNFTAGVTNGYYVTANITSTLPVGAGVPTGSIIYFVSGSASGFTIAPGAGQTIMGDSSLVVDTPNAWFALVLIGTDWRIAT